jgi:dihydroorotate dehydrogenase (fumarate)
VYHVATDPAESAYAVEARVLDVLRAVRAAVRIPLAVKLSPFYSASRQLDLVADDSGCSEGQPG